MSCKPTKIDGENGGPGEGLSRLSGERKRNLSLEPLADGGELPLQGVPIPGGGVGPLGLRIQEAVQTSRQDLRSWESIENGMVPSFQKKIR